MTERVIPAQVNPGIMVRALRCEYLTEPLGMHTMDPRLSWVIESGERGLCQTCYQILVAGTPEVLAGDLGDLWDSGKVESDQTIHVKYAGNTLTARLQCFWKVRVWDRSGRASAWSATASWTMGLLEASDWKAKWIACPSERTARVRQTDEHSAFLPATMVRREFDLKCGVKRALVSVTGLGVYEMSINGRRVGDQVLAPEWTCYGKRIQYQTFDVTDLLLEGKNAICAQMGGGWWTGLPVPMVVLPKLNRVQFCLLARLDIELVDGSKNPIVTDSSWLATDEGPIRKAGIYFGEIYDATREMPGWDQPGFADSGWRTAEELAHPDGSENAALVAQRNEPIRVVRELEPLNVTEPRPGVYVFDLGQNMVGWFRLMAETPAGANIILRFAELVNDDGTIYTANLRNAAQIYEYTSRGGSASVEPHFTYFGFRYVEVSGLDSRPGCDALRGLVIHSAAPDAGQFTCSNELVNGIMHCVEWVQRGHLYSVPTDCPQRDERLGWTGDIQSFSQTAIFNMDMAGFFSKWMLDMRDGQLPDGRFLNIAPHPADPQFLVSEPHREYGPAWSDAGVVIPWRMYENYGDTRLLMEHFESAKRWVEFIHVYNPERLWLNNRGGDYGDWLNGDTVVLDGYPSGVSAVPKDLLATAFYAGSTEMLSKMAKVLGREEDAARYGRLFGEIKAAFNREYVAADGRMTGDTQAGYALALYFNLLEESLRKKAVEYLLEGIQKYNNHLSTGIQTSHRAMLELTRNGQHDEAYRLLNLRTVPSWGYMVDMGATTIWERWDAYVEGRGFQDPIMNSCNHWALGSVGEWIWRELAGINPDESRPGYKHIIIRPRPCGDLTEVSAHYDSIRGRIKSEWRIVGSQFHLNVEIPANTTATVFLPVKDEESVTEGGLSALEAEGVRFEGKEGESSVFIIESGQYKFRGRIS